MTPIEERLARFTGLDVTLQEATRRLADYGAQLDPPEWVVYAIAADYADEEAARLTRTSGVTQVEDIAIDRGKAIDGWLALAARLRARSDDLQWGDGPLLVRNTNPWVEATEHG